LNNVTEKIYHKNVHQLEISGKWRKTILHRRDKAGNHCTSHEYQELPEEEILLVAKVKLRVSLYGVEILKLIPLCTNK